MLDFLSLMLDFNSIIRIDEILSLWFKLTVFITYVGF